MERIPFQATSAGAAYPFRKLPVQVALADIRSLYNVGAFFRTCDASGVDTLHLCGITGYPPAWEIRKTALGAEDSVEWRRHATPLTLIDSARGAGYEIAAVETSLHAVDLFDWQPRFPVCLVFGNEVAGLAPDVSAACDT